MNIFEKILKADPLEDHGGKIPTGKHTLLLSTFGAKETSIGEIIAAEFVVAETTNAEVQVGSIVSTIWQPNANYYVGAGAKELSRCQNFVGTLIDSDDREAIARAAASLADATMPGRGLAIIATGTFKPSKKRKDGNGMTKEFVDVKWHSVDAAGQNVPAQRAAVEKVVTAPAAPAQSAPVVAISAPAAPIVVAPAQSAPAVAISTPVAPGGFRELLRGK